MKLVTEESNFKKVAGNSYSRHILENFQKQETSVAQKLSTLDYFRGFKDLASK